MNSDLQIAIAELESLPIGMHISDPDKLVETGLKLPAHIGVLIGASSEDVYFTRRSLKHVLEKGQEGHELLDISRWVVKSPHAVLAAKGRRYFLTRSSDRVKTGRPCVVAVEIMKDSPNIIVTIFQSDGKYLSNFELLWRTGDS